MEKQYRSGIMVSIHETAEGLRSAGVIDNQTMRKFDEACLTQFRPFSAEEMPGYNVTMGDRAIQKGHE